MPQAQIGGVPFQKRSQEAVLISAITFFLSASQHRKAIGSVSLSSLPDHLFLPSIEDLIRISLDQ